MDTMWIAAADTLRGLGYEWRGGEWVKREPAALYGCHVDLEDGMEPDGCVLDQGMPELCVVAQRLHDSGKCKTDCQYWRPAENAR